MKKILALVTMVLTLGSTIAMASDGIYLGEPGYGGSGCPSGSASVTLSPDNTALSIIFDDYMVEAGGADGKKVARKNCSIAIPVHVPQGFSVSLIEADYRGYVSLPRQAQARFSVEYFFAGKQGPKYNKTFSGYTDKDYTINNKLGVYANVWSACGADVNLRVNSSLLVRTNRHNDEALATVDTADFSSGIIYQLQWKRCH